MSEFALKNSTHEDASIYFSLAVIDKDVLHCIAWSKKQRSPETRINLSADLYKLHPGKIDHFKTGWSVFAIFQNDVLYLGVVCTPVYPSLQWSMKEILGHTLSRQCQHFKNSTQSNNIPFFENRSSNGIKMQIGKYFFIVLWF